MCKLKLPASQVDVNWFLLQNFINVHSIYFCLYFSAITRCLFLTKLYYVKQMKCTH